MQESQLSFVTANYVAREGKYNIQPWSWGAADKITQDAFHSPEFEQKFDELARMVADLGFKNIEIWVAHLNPWRATPEMVDQAVDILKKHNLNVCGYTAGFGRPNMTREEAEVACRVANKIGSPILSVGLNPTNEDLAAQVCRDFGLKYAIENHPEKSPQDMLARLQAIEQRNGGRYVGVASDTGWWASQGADPVEATHVLKDYLYHVHLKDVKQTGAHHETCALGDGIVDIRGILNALNEIGYKGYISIEHEPEFHDPTEDIRKSLERVREWM